MVVGEDFHFGHNRRGDYHMLRQYAGKYGYEVIVVEKIKRRQPGHQQHVREGRDRSREYREGKSSSGIPLLCDQQSPARQTRSEERSGFRPSTSCRQEKLLPPNGVYVTEAYIGDRWYRGISNVGCKPTIEGRVSCRGGTHLLDFAEDVYDKMVTVEFLSRVRSERKFASIEALKEQMQNDVAYGRKSLF